MAKPRSSKDFRKFDALTRDLLTVPKSALNEQIAAHKAKVAATPQHKKRGPKPKVTSSGNWCDHKPTGRYSGFGRSACPRRTRMTSPLRFR